jgi:cobalt-zinc-cadmium efflux system protein
MSHTHSHSHSPKPANHSKAFGYGIALNVTYIIIEVIYGLASNSMALIADAGHNLSDVLGLVLAWGASYLAKTAITSNRTYGLRKSTVLAAFLNALILLIAVGAISVEAVRKIINPVPIGGTTMMIVAGIGVVVNGLTAMLFMKGREKDINIKGAFLHMAADAGISLGVVIAGLLISLTGFYLIDPLMSIIIVLVITYGTWGLLRDSFSLSMDAVPREINLGEVKKCLTNLDGVVEVHDLHIWAMSTTETALTVHLVMPCEPFDEKFLNNTCCILHDKFGIEHSTIQIEKGAHAANCREGHV